jgi:hypothetical protein
MKTGTREFAGDQDSLDISERIAFQEWLATPAPGRVQTFIPEKEPVSRELMKAGMLAASLSAKLPRITRT